MMKRKIASQVPEEASICQTKFPRQFVILARLSAGQDIVKRERHDVIGCRGAQTIKSRDGHPLTSS